MLFCKILLEDCLHVELYLLAVLLVDTNIFPWTWMCLVLKVNAVGKVYNWTSPAFFFFSKNSLFLPQNGSLNNIPGKYEHFG